MFADKREKLWALVQGNVQSKIWTENSERNLLQMLMKKTKHLFKNGKKIIDIFPNILFIWLFVKMFFIDIFISYYYLEKFVNPSFKNELFVVKQFQKST